ncbi:MAG: hypothetical protein ACTSU3_06985 [Candidatus Thorarchaeota archaeon]
MDGQVKTKYTLTLCLIIFILCSFPTVNAQNSQGLYWGVENNTRVYYQVDSSSESQNVGFTPIHGIIYLLIQDLPEIPENVIGFADFMQYNLSVYWENGTQIQYSNIVPFFFIVWPIGNWTLYSEWILGQLSGPYIIEIIDTPDLWGFNQAMNLTNIDMETLLEFSKIDGCISHTLSFSRNVSSGLLDFRSEVTRIGANLPILIASGGIIGIEIIIVIIILKKAKSRSAKEPESSGIQWEDVFPS